VTSQRYPRLADFMVGWFHQDFDLEGETVEAVVKSFCAVTPPHQQRALRQDITRFLKDCAGDLDGEFQRLFQPDVIPAALSGSTRAFLETIRNGLAS
jgi:hypothetical protein